MKILTWIYLSFINLAFLFFICIFPGKLYAEDNVVANGIRQKPPHTIYFTNNSKAITVEGSLALDLLLDNIKSENLKAIRIVGHADTLGGRVQNYMLSANRSKSVKSWLTEKGLDKSILKTSWKGELDPPYPTSDGVAEPLNRCVEIFIE